ncbi:hypothetical protein IFM12275_56480 [Nocardia sputorum]|uniref:Uncharacterized protein n=1 Tax=Nocardia sputorum TaxID=2984338 RepID=A0ABN6TX25_9NOCA|nr:hypothetical protein IFM12275_56480 [Nocardia sputorum]BDT97451.1 hypothetical protein IFM12276_04800 [Nocardia sputorum]
MAEYAPTLVAIYDVGHAQPRRVAEFGSNPDGGVTLTVIDPDGCLVAERLYERGIKVFDPPRRILPDEGPPFLRALLDSQAMSYYRVVDESPDERQRPSGRTPWSANPASGSNGASTPPAR